MPNISINTLGSDYVKVESGGKSNNSDNLYNKKFGNNFNPFADNYKQSEERNKTDDIINVDQQKNSTIMM